MINSDNRGKWKRLRERWIALQPEPIANPKGVESELMNELGQIGAGLNGTETKRAQLGWIEAKLVAAKAEEYRLLPLFKWLVDVVFVKGKSIDEAKQHKDCCTFMNLVKRRRTNLELVVTLESIIERLEKS